MGLLKAIIKETEKVTSDKPMPRKKTLREHQREGIEWGLAHTTGKARERWVEQMRIFEEGR